MKKDQFNRLIDFQHRYQSRHGHDAQCFEKGACLQIRLNSNRVYVGLVMAAPQCLEKNFEINEITLLNIFKFFLGALLAIYCMVYGFFM